MFGHSSAMSWASVRSGIEICITFPTEYVKTQLQLDERSAKPKFKGPIDCVKQTVKSHGFFGLYRGLSVLIYGSIPKSSFRFGTFEFLKGKAIDDKGNLTPLKRLACGLGAGVSEAIFAVTPMETVKVKFINDQALPNPRYKGIYKGVVATIAKQGTNQAIRFFVMETLKDWYRGGDNSIIISKPIIGLMGATAGFCSVYGNTPIDVVKTRMQGLESSKYKSTIDCAVQIWRKEGFFAFYKGAVPRLSRVMLDCAITFMIYDSIVDFLNAYWRKPVN
ncbi:hypothetical protein DICVIV_07459 [Dictyocaulus viviparus]|uniref:Citrate transport protein n=1 Tax=Dictyocaulus viviparus TaxID=29172 RepID=A0A0D8XRT1_DICVI|nr:hypothetical protein DICVIV_07459 [Dictyocaulus viviparus]